MLPSSGGLWNLALNTGVQLRVTLLRGRADPFSSLVATGFSPGGPEGGQRLRGRKPWSAAWLLGKWPVKATEMEAWCTPAWTLQWTGLQGLGG